MEALSHAFLFRRLLPRHVGMWVSASQGTANANDSQHIMPPTVTSLTVIEICHLTHACA